MHAKQNEIYEKVLRGTFRDCLEEPWYQEAPAPQRTRAQEEEDKRQGVEPPPPDDTTSLMICEQHVNLDLDFLIGSLEVFHDYPFQIVILPRQTAVVNFIQNQWKCLSECK